MRDWILAVVWTVLLLALVILLCNYFYVFCFSRRERCELDKETQRALEQNEFHLPREEEVIIEAFDGIRLAGFFYLQTHSLEDTVNRNNKFAIILHGYGLTHEQMRAYGDFYYNELDYQVLMPDLRGHGESEGDYVGFGWHDRLDVLAWIDYLEQRFGISIQIVLHGVSMGAATALLTGEEQPPHLRAVISDCAYPWACDIFKYQMKRQFRLQPFPFLYLLDWGLRKKAGYSVFDGDILKNIDHLKTPVLYIHGDQDDFIPSQWVYRLYEKTAASKALYLCPNAGHGKSLLTEPKEYKRRIVRFLKSVDL